MRAFSLHQKNLEREKVAEEVKSKKNFQKETVKQKFSIKRQVYNNCFNFAREQLESKSKLQTNNARKFLFAHEALEKRNSKSWLRLSMCQSCNKLRGSHVHFLLLLTSSSSKIYFSRNYTFSIIMCE